MKAELRIAEPGDVPAISAIEESSFPCPWSEGAIYGEMKNDLATFKVLALGEKIIGYYDLWVCADEAHLLNVAVVPSEQRRGYGAMMLGDAIEIARSRGCRRVVLEVRPSNRAALVLYEKFGFKTITRRPRYYSDGEDAEVMLRDI